MSKKNATTAVVKQSATTKALRKKIEAAIDTVYDPEIPVSIWQLGLIYRIDIDDKKNVHITMTLTSPSCPVAGILPRDVQRKVSAVSGIGRVRIEITFDPPWTPDRMTEAARFELGMM